VTGQGDVRASDADRDETAAALGAHWTDGRLDEAELDRRVSAAYAAVTRAELDELLRDLPRERRPSRPEPTRKRLFLPGVRYFQEQAELAASRERAFEQALSTIVPGLGAAGYHLVDSQRPERMRFAMRKGVLQTELPLTLLFLPGAAGGCRIVAFGEAPRGVRKGLAQLRD
jgi:hypothetical protein